MKLEQYLNRKRDLLAVYREHCHTCNRAASVCLCDLIKPFETNTRFVILMHPKEAQKEKSGTGRLCHLTLKNSSLHVGIDFTDDRKVNALIEDLEYVSVLLFPTRDAVNLSEEGYRSLIGHKGKLQIFIVDGTWSLAKKLLGRSENLRSLPTVSFTPRQPSNFKFKKQPNVDYLSTLESIQLLLELGQEQGIESLGSNIHQLPEIFDSLVQIQLQGADFDKS